MKNILVTGGSSGIGYAIAELAKHRGYDVYITGRDGAKLDQAAQELGVTGYVADMEIVDDVKSLAAHFQSLGIDALVNNAAIPTFAPISAQSEADYAKAININLRGPMMLCQYLIPALEKRSGSITNISSAIVNNGLANASLYAATKGGIEAFTRSLAIELASKGVRVNCVSPGAVDTPLMQKLGLAPEEVRAIIAHQEKYVIPLGRYAKPGEIAHVVLAQLEATYATGMIWSIDGGVSAQ